MKRYGHLIERIIDPDNMEEAFNAVLRCKKNTRATRFVKLNKAPMLRKIAQAIKLGIYAPEKYREFEILEGRKMREIQSLSFRDRIALHAIMRVINEIFTPKLIRDTYASLPGRGIHDGLGRIKKAFKDKEGTKYCLKIDLKKFYHSVDQDKLIELLESKIKDKKLMKVLTNIIRSFHKGLPIGYHSSQMLGNFYLCPLDYYVKQTLKVKHYFRYCDDIVILASEKAELHQILAGMKTIIEDELHLTIKDNYQIFPVEARGIDFLGYIIRHDYTLVRKHIKQRVARKLKKIKSEKRRLVILASFWGWVKHCNSKNLFYKYTNMKSFKDLKVSHMPADGKKRFGGELTPLGQLQNCEISVLDFETEISTEMGDGRYVVQYEFNGKPGKFITNSEELKDILDQIKNLGELPFTTTIQREFFGSNKVKYKFT